MFGLKNYSNNLCSKGFKGQNCSKIVDNSDTINRRSWDSSKLESQIEEEPPEVFVTPPEEDYSKVNNTTVTKVSKSPDLGKKEDKDRMFSKFKVFKKGEIFN